MLKANNVKFNVKLNLWRMMKKIGTGAEVSMIPGRQFHLIGMAISMSLNTDITFNEKEAEVVKNFVLFGLAFLKQNFSDTDNDKNLSEVFDRFFKGNGDFDFTESEKNDLKTKLCIDS